MPTLTGMYTGALWESVEQNHRAYMFNGRNRMRTFDGVNFRLGGIKKVTGSITATVGAGSGANLTGSYIYIAVPVNTKHLIFGRPDKQVKSGLPMGQSALVSPSGQKVQISGIPTHTDAQVDYWYIYRNKSGEYLSDLGVESQPFFYVGRVTNGTSTFDDPVASDDSLNDLSIVDFKANVPLPFKFGFVYNDVMYGYGFDPILTGTATKNGSDATLIDFSGVSIPDGVEGCRFKKVGDTTSYIITSRVSATQIQLDSAFSGTLSAGEYSIYLEESMLWNSNWRDFDAWGPDTELRRNSTPIGGRGSLEPITGHAVTGGAAYVFTLTKIYRLHTTASSRFQPAGAKLVYDGAGSVGGRAVTVVDDTIYFMSLQGPYRFRPETGKPEYIGEQLGEDWLDDLINTEKANMIVCSYSPKRQVIKFDAPEPDEDIPSVTYVYDMQGRWWKEAYKHPLLRFRDYDAVGAPALFYAQGAYIVQDDEGTTDGLPTGCTQTGTITAKTTTSATDASATFTTSNGLVERYVHFWRNGTFLGCRKITSNTGTVLNWTTALAGLAVGDRYYIAPVSWYWKSKDYHLEAGQVKSKDLNILYDNIPTDEAGVMHVQQYQDGVAVDAPSTEDVWQKIQKPMTGNISGFTWAAKFYSPKTNAQWSIRDLGVEIYPFGNNK